MRNPTLGVRLMILTKYVSFTSPFKTFVGTLGLEWFKYPRELRCLLSQLNTPETQYEHTSPPRQNQTYEIITLRL